MPGVRGIDPSHEHVPVPGCRCAVVACNVVVDAYGRVANHRIGRLLERVTLRVQAAGDLAPRPGVPRYRAADVAQNVRNDGVRGGDVTVGCSERIQVDTAG